MKNLAFAKIGKSIKFKSHYSPIGGDNEPSAIFKALVNNNPDKTFYLVGRSDYEKLSELERIEMFPYSNVVNCYKKCGSVVDKKDYLINWFNDNNITIDFGIMMMGQVGTVAIPGKTEQVRNRELIASVIDMTKNYSTPIVNWLNETNIKWIELINDPRYTKAQARDFVATPESSISQYDYQYTHSRIKSFLDQDRDDYTQDAKYSGIETAFCVGNHYPDIVNKEKNNKFIIVLNEGKPPRYKMLKEWVLDYLDDVEVYGKWDDKATEEDERFKGAIKLDQVQEKVKESKYTFIIPIRKGWVTSKYIEMIHAGCIPFFHPTYDEQKHINVPELLRPKTPKELHEAIEVLENEPEVRNEVLKELQQLLLKEYYSGEYINDVIMKEIYLHNSQDYNKIDLGNYQKEEYNTLF